MDQARTRGGERGAAALAMTLGIILIMTLFGLAFLVYARRQSSLVGTDQDSAMALYAAEAGFEKARREMESKWKLYLGDQATNKANNQLRWFKCSNNGNAGTACGNQFSNYQYSPPQNEPFPRPPDNPTATYSVAVAYTYQDQSTVDPTTYVNATITVTGQTPSGRQKIVEGVVRFEIAPSQVFNYAYFINNKAKIQIEAGRINGHVRANGNINVVSGYINGEIIGGVNADIGSGNLQDGEGCVLNPNLISFDATAAAYTTNSPVTTKRPAKPGIP